LTVATFIVAQRTEHGVPHAVARRTVDVAESTFYKWRDRAPTPRQARRGDVPAHRDRMGAQAEEALAAMTAEPEELGRYDR